MEKENKVKFKIENNTIIGTYLDGRNTIQSIEIPKEALYIKDLKSSVFSKDGRNSNTYKITILKIHQDFTFKENKDAKEFVQNSDILNSTDLTFYDVDKNNPYLESKLGVLLNKKTKEILSIPTNYGYYEFPLQNSPNTKNYEWTNKLYRINDLTSQKNIDEFIKQQKSVVGKIFESFINDFDFNKYEDNFNLQVHIAIGYIINSLDNRVKIRDIGDLLYSIKLSSTIENFISLHKNQILTKTLELKELWDLDPNNYWYFLILRYLKSKKIIQFYDVKKDLKSDDNQDDFIGLSKQLETILIKKSFEELKDFVIENKNKKLFNSRVLAIATRYKDLNTIKFLIDNGFDFNYTSKFSQKELNQLDKVFNIKLQRRMIDKKQKWIIKRMYHEYEVLFLLPSLTEEYLTSCNTELSLIEIDSKTNEIKGLKPNDHKTILDILKLLIDQKVLNEYQIQNILFHSFLLNLKDIYQYLLGLNIKLRKDHIQYLSFLEPNPDTTYTKNPELDKLFHSYRYPLAVNLINDPDNYFALGKLVYETKFEDIFFTKEEYNKIKYLPYKQSIDFWSITPWDFPGNKQSISKFKIYCLVRLNSIGDEYEYIDQYFDNPKLTLDFLKYTDFYGPSFSAIVTYLNNLRTFNEDDVLLQDIYNRLRRLTYPFFKIALTHNYEALEFYLNDKEVLKDPQTLKGIRLLLENSDDDKLVEIFKKFYKSLKD